MVALRPTHYFYLSPRLGMRRTAPMIKVNDKLKHLARTLADWAADKSVTIFLFGSRVRGDHRPDSDVDIFVQFGDMTKGTAVWWTEQNSEDFASLKGRLPGPLKILDANAPLVLSVKKAEVVYRDRNVVCVLLPRA
jgi:predicted nucleotidyltransferase